MASSIKLKINSEKYTTPNAEDIQDAKEFVLLREETGLLLQGRIDNMLEEAAERIVIICYAYGVDPKRLLFSSSFNEEMMMEIGDVMNELEEEIMDLMLDYSTRVTTDKDRINALLLWLSTLGRGDRNLQETLEGYMYKMMQDWNAAIAAMMYMGVKEKEAVTKIKTYLHDIYQMPEVMTVIRSRRTEFAATYIYYGGIQKGAVGISNNGSTNVTNLAKRTLQMAWMRSQAMDFKEDGASGYYQLRGSTYNCDICDDEVGFHPNIDEILTKPYPHPGCCCYRVPIYGKDVFGNNKNGKLEDERQTDNVKANYLKERRKEIKKEALSLRDELFTNDAVSWVAKISGAGIDEWLNQPHKHIIEKNEALLDLVSLYGQSEYIKATNDPKGRKDIANSHIFKTKIAGEDSWIIVNEMKWGEYKIHSITDSNPLKTVTGN